MLRVLIALALTCLLQPAFADERAQTQQQLDATRQDIAELKKLLGKLQEEKSGVQKDSKAPKPKWASSRSRSRPCKRAEEERIRAAATRCREKTPERTH
jgi:uncharacterized protein YlxW (UPF0749 family)